MSESDLIEKIAADLLQCHGIVREEAGRQHYIGRVRWDFRQVALLPVRITHGRIHPLNQSKS